MFGLCFTATLAAPGRHLDGPLSDTTTTAPVGQAADQLCFDLCRARGLCCNNWTKGSNQRISCAQACMMRHRGESRDAIVSRCPDLRCFLTVNNFEYGFCSTCEDLTSATSCNFGVPNFDMCELGAGLELCQPNLSGQVATLYDIYASRYVAFDISAASDSKAMYLLDSSDPRAHWRVNLGTAGWSFASEQLSSWRLSFCETIHATDLELNTTYFELQQISSGLFRISSPCVSFGMIIETYPRNFQACHGTDSQGSSGGSCMPSLLPFLLCTLYVLYLFDSLCFRAGHECPDGSHGAETVLLERVSRAGHGRGRLCCSGQLQIPVFLNPFDRGW